MKIATSLATAALLALTLSGAGAAVADTGVGHGGTNSHYPPVHQGVGHGGDNPYVDGHEGVGHGGTNSHYPPLAVKAKKKATGQVARAVHVFDSGGRTIKTRLVIKNVRASKITVTTVSCKGEVLKKGSRDTHPGAAGIWSFEYKVRAPEGAAMTIVKFSQPNKRSTKQVIYTACV